MRHLTSLLTHRDLRAEMVATAQRKVAAEYTHEAMRAWALVAIAQARQIAAARAGSISARVPGPTKAESKA